MRVACRPCGLWWSGALAGFATLCVELFEQDLSGLHGVCWGSSSAVCEYSGVLLENTGSRLMRKRRRGVINPFNMTINLDDCLYVYQGSCTSACVGGRIRCRRASSCSRSGASAEKRDASARATATPRRCASGAATGTA